MHDDQRRSMSASVTPYYVVTVLHSAPVRLLLSANVVNLHTGRQRSLRCAALDRLPTRCLWRRSNNVSHQGRTQEKMKGPKFPLLLPSWPLPCLSRHPIQSHLGLDYTNITKNPPPAQNDTVHSYNAFSITSIVFCINIIIFYYMNYLHILAFLFLLIAILQYCSVLFYSAIELCCCKHVNKSSCSSLPPFPLPLIFPFPSIPFPFPNPAMGLGERCISSPAGSGLNLVH